jgi:hypothetical protein
MSEEAYDIASKNPSRGQHPASNAPGVSIPQLLSPLRAEEVDRYYNDVRSSVFLSPEPYMHLYLSKQVTMCGE